MKTKLDKIDLEKEVFLLSVIPVELVFLIHNENLHKIHKEQAIILHEEHISTDNTSKIQIVPFERDLFEYSQEYNHNSKIFVAISSKNSRNQLSN